MWPATLEMLMMVPPPCWRMTGMTACIADNGAEEVRLEHVVAGMHIDLRDGIEQPVAGVVDPDIDTLEMMQGQGENAVDLFRVADIAGESNGAIGIPDAGASGFGTGGVAR